MDYAERQKKQWETKRKNGTDIPWNKGLTKSDPRVAKYSRGHSDRMKGRKLSEEHKRKIGEKSKGHKLSIEARIKISNSKRGSKSHFWKGGLTEINKLIRQSIEYKLWREAVFTRDKFTCQLCKQLGGKLNADHIKSFALYPEFRTSIENGRTLCHPCHKKTESYGKNNLTSWERDSKGKFSLIIN